MYTRTWYQYTTTFIQLVHAMCHVVVAVVYKHYRPCTLMNLRGSFVTLMKRIYEHNPMDTLQRKK